MNERHPERIKQLLKSSLPPISSGVNAELRRDLWSAMLKRLSGNSSVRVALPVVVPWFDWALLAAVVAWLVFFPSAIPVLLYHL